MNKKNLHINMLDILPLRNKNKKSILHSMNLLNVTNQVNSFSIKSTNRLTITLRFINKVKNIC